MSKVCYILFLSCIPAFDLLAQTNSVDTQYTISGSLEESDTKKPVLFASIALYKADSSLLGGVNSDENGKFNIQAPAGNYYLKITYIAFQDKIISGVKISNKNVELGTIALKPSSTTLDEVVVTGEKTQMDLQLDKRVFNVAKDMSNIGTNASDILNNVPSVTVDVEGNVALRGSQNVRILIDGKQSGMVGMNPAEALKQIPGDLIESIEVITNPSSRYDAEGEVGILNIIMKKNVRYGLNGTFNITAGYPSNFGGSFSLNFRKKKVNFIANYGTMYRESPGKGSSRQAYSGADTSFVYEQNSSRTRSGFSNNAVVGLDYYINNFNTLTTTLSLRKSRNENESVLEYKDFDLDNQLTRTVVRTELETEPRTNFEAAVNYVKTFEKKGERLSVDLKYILSDETESSKYDQKDIQLADVLKQRSYNTENEKDFLAQIDYVLPFATSGKFEAGFKSSVRMLDNDFSVHQQIEEGYWQIIPEFDNYLAYNEKIHAAYVMGSNQFGKVSIQAGLRGEYSDIETELKKTQEKNHRQYFNLFPSAHLSYKLDDANTLQLSYSYRLSRPRFRDLLPFSNFSDSRVFRAGNPLLNPEYTHSMEVGHLLNFPKGTLLSSIYYRNTTGVVENITSVDSSGFTTITPVNLSTGNSYGFEFNLSYDPFQWWKWNASANIYRAMNEGVYNDQEFKSDTYTWTSRVTSRATIAKLFDFQASFNYRAPRNTTQGRDLAMYAIDLGLSKDVLKGKGTVTMSVRDLLNSQIRRSIVEYEGYYSKSEFQGRVRQFLVTFAYRLNRSPEKRQSDNNSDFGEDD